MKIIKYLPYVFVLILTSCFEIVEDVKVNQNGSGTYKIIVNLSQSKSQLDKIKTQDNIQGKPIPNNEKIQSEFDQLLNKLKQEEGVTNVLGTIDLLNYKLNLQFDFDKIETLNNVSPKLIQQYVPGSVYVPIQVKFDGKNYSKSYDQNLLNEAKKGIEQAGVLLSGIENAKITSITRFEVPISKVENQNAKISSSLKNCILQLQLEEILNNPDNQRIEILL